MIITRTPLRISIGGGGTDLPSYYSKFGSFFISAAINKYVYIGMQETFTKEVVLKYSKIERVKKIEDIEHEIIRKALHSYDLEKGFEMASFADIPAGTGLGSSGTFTVGLLKGLYALSHKTIAQEQLAAEASHLLMNELKRPDGKQDQYAAAYGGINGYTIDKKGNVSVEPLRITEETLNKLQDRLVLFFTGFYRQSEKILNVQKQKSETGDKAMIEGLHFIQELGHKIKKMLESGKTDEFGMVIKEHWEYKKKRAKDMSNSLIDDWYGLALKNGALGGKVIGAGGGGFLMFYTNDREKTIHALAKAGMRHVRFDFDFEGSKLLVN